MFHEGRCIGYAGETKDVVEVRRGVLGGRCHGGEGTIGHVGEKDFLIGARLDGHSHIVDSDGVDVLRRLGHNDDIGAVFSAAAFS